MSADKNFEIRILTPERVFLSGNISQIVVETIDGSMGILKDIAPQIIALVPGEMKILQNDRWKVASNGSGFIEIKDKKVLIMVETAEWPFEIETERVKKTIRESEELLRQNKSYKEYLLSKASLARAFARLKVKGGGN